VPHTEQQLQSMEQRQRPRTAAATERLALIMKESGQTFGWAGWLWPRVYKLRDGNWQLCAHELRVISRSYPSHTLSRGSACCPDYGAQ